MRRGFFICSSVLLALFFWGTCFAGNADEHFPFLGEVSRGPLNVRAGANANFEAVDKLEKGAEVVVLGRSYEWYKIQLPSSSDAFIRADYIEKHPANIGELTGDRVNLRARANSESSAVGQLRKGDLVKLIEQTNGWWKIQPPAGSFAWVHSDFVRFKSAEVPPQLQQKPLLLPEAAVVSGRTKGEGDSAQGAAVMVQGSLQSMLPAPQADVHYQILVDGRPVYYLHDAPHLENFDRAVVRVEGAAGPKSNSACPVLYLKKISLVL